MLRETKKHILEESIYQTKIDHNDYAGNSFTCHVRLQQYELIALRSNEIGSPLASIVSTNSRLRSLDIDSPLFLE